MRARTISVLTAGAIIAAAAVAVYAAPGNPPSARGSRGWTSDAQRPAQGQMQADDDWGPPGGGRGGAWRRGGGPGRGGNMGPCGMGGGFGMRGRGFAMGMGGGFGMGRGYGGLAAGLLRPDGPLADRLKLTGTQKDKLHGIGEDLARKMIQHRADMATARLDLMDLIKNNSSDRSRIDSQIDTIAKLRADGMKTRITALLDARDVLTSEQRSQLEEWRGSRGPGRGGRR
jgi:Spy/CpxP family protein refolding chaperone